MSGYWPSWVGALSLGLITVGYTLWAGRSLGVSGAWDRVVHWRSERRVERMDAEFSDDSALLEALVAVTREEYGDRSARPGSMDPQAQSDRQAVVGRASGDAAVTQNTLLEQNGMFEPEHAVPFERNGMFERNVGFERNSMFEPDVPFEQSGMIEQRVGTVARATPRRPLPVLCHAAMLISIFLGGLLAAVQSGRFHLRTDMGQGFSQIVTGNRLVMVGLLFVGGVFVGFGTRLAGGCSSGHGLGGCSRLQPASILATVVFFGTAVVVSVLLWKVI
jgi:hypothetical protein